MSISLFPLPYRYLLYILPCRTGNQQSQCSCNCSLNTFIINWLIESSFCSESSRHSISQTVRAGELKYLENIHPPPCVTCHMSHIKCVTCNMSWVMCPNNLSGVTWKVSYVTFFFFSVGASLWRVCYQRGLPRLVLFIFTYFSTYSYENLNGECYIYFKGI